MEKRLGFIGQSLIQLLDIYQATDRYRRPCCRFYPSCSSYAKQAIIVRGVFMGLILASWRVLRCWPGLTCQVDEVPLKEKKS